MGPLQGFGQEMLREGVAALPFEGGVEGFVQGTEGDHARCHEHAIRAIDKDVEVFPIALAVVGPTGLGGESEEILGIDDAFHNGLRSWRSSRQVRP